MLHAATCLYRASIVHFCHTIPLEPKAALTPLQDNSEHNCRLRNRRGALMSPCRQSAREGEPGVKAKD